MSKKRLVVAMAPYAKSGRTIKAMVLTTIACLAPAAAFGMFQYGYSAVLLLVCAMASALLTEAIIGKLSGQLNSIKNGHAILVGLVLAMLLPPDAPFWIAIVGASTGILIGKLPFGPLGGSPISPAIIGLLVVTLSWPTELTRFETPNILPENTTDGLTTEVSRLAEDPQTAISIDPSDMREYRLIDMGLGHYPGLLGTAPLFCLLGGLALIGFTVVRWQGAFAYLLGLGAFATLANVLSPDACPPVAFQLLSGATIFAAFFLCTEWSSTPNTPKGMFLFGLTAGGLTILFRVTGMPVGAEAYAVAISSLATPLFDRIAEVPFGKVVDHA